MRKIFAAIVVVLSVAVCACAMPIEEIAKISVNADGSNFQ